MLYDPKWDLYSLERFSAWLDEQPKHKEYDYTNPWDCAFAQYLQANGVSREDSCLDSE